MTSRPLWISWERHRRSLELADALGVECAVLHCPGGYYLRTPVLVLRTLLWIARARPRLLFVQNPSIVLAAVACFLRRPCRYRLVVDRHSNFELRVDSVSRVERWLYHVLSRYSVREADLTIVTNESLRRRVAEMQGRGFVLPDRTPTLPFAKRSPLGPGSHIVFVCSFAPDEPLAAVCGAAARLAGEVTIHVTGRPKKSSRSIIAGAPSNVSFTGFLAEGEYQALLASADGIMVLTRASETLVCGAYEAVAVGVPLILSNHKVLREHFHQGAVFTGHDPGQIAVAIQSLLRSRERFELAIRELKGEHERSWQRRFAVLCEMIQDLQPGR
jgi:glycosyltransferase involved in cell wall biosynthesis